MYKSTQLSTIGANQDMGARVLHAKFDFTATETIASGEKIELVDLGKGAKLLSLNATSDVAITIGDNGKSDIFASATTFTENNIQGLQDAVKSAQLTGSNGRLNATLQAGMAMIKTVIQLPAEFISIN